MREPNRSPINQAVIDELLTTRNSKWTPTVVLHLRHETLRFSELQREIGTISQKALTASLRALERDGFVTRTSYATIPPRVDYALTELGTEALKAFEAFETFGSSSTRAMPTNPSLRCCGSAPGVDPRRAAPA